MIKRNQDGSISGMAVSLVLTVVLLLIVLIFGVWAFSSRQDYKNNVDSKVAAAVKVAQQQQTTADNAAFAEASKSPLTTYNGPADYGSIAIQYPKTWSGYVDSNGQSTNGAPLSVYFAPGVVPSVNDQSSVYALTVQVLNQPYSQTIQNFTSQEQSGGLTAKAYSLPKVPSAVGVELTGQISSNSSSVSGTMVVLPLRTDTLEITTSGTQYLGDFNNYILPNFTFSP